MFGNGFCGQRRKRAERLTYGLFSGDPMAGWLFISALEGRVTFGGLTLAGNRPWSLMLGLRLRHQGAFSCWPRAGAGLRLFTRWMSCLEAQHCHGPVAGTSKPERQHLPPSPAGLHPLGLEVTTESLHSWPGSHLWEDGAGCTVHLLPGGGESSDQGLGQARQAGPLETRNQTAEDGDFASPRPPYVFVSLIPLMVGDTGFPKACAATTTRSLTLSVPKASESRFSWGTRVRDAQTAYIVSTLLL